MPALTAEDLARAVLQVYGHYERNSVTKAVLVNQRTKVIEILTSVLEPDLVWETPVMALPEHLEGYRMILDYEGGSSFYMSLKAWVQKDNLLSPRQMEALLRPPDDEIADGLLNCGLKVPKYQLQAEALWYRLQEQSLREAFELSNHVEVSPEPEPPSVEDSPSIFKRIWNRRRGH